MNDDVASDTEYRIHRTPDYRYVLSHRALGEIRKYRTRMGAQRALERHKKTSGVIP